MADDASGAVSSAQGGDRPIRVAYYTHYVPDYRHGVFELINAERGIEFIVAASDRAADPTIYCPQNHQFRFRKISYGALRLPNGRNRVSFSHHVILAVLKREFDVLILSNDILGVDVWLCVCLKRLFNVRVVVWGQGISKPETRVRVWLRRQLMNRSDACIFYGEDARETWVRRGLPENKLFVAYNALDTDVQLGLKNQFGPAELQDFREQEGLIGKRVFCTRDGWWQQSGRTSHWGP